MSVDWTYIPDEKARWKGMTKPKALKPLRSRLKHKLEYDRRNDRWKCTAPHCGFVLGVHGHSALYAKCPFFPNRKVGKPWAKKTSHQNDERFSSRRKSFLQGELLPPLEDAPKAANNKKVKTNNEPRRKLKARHPKRR